MNIISSIIQFFTRRPRVSPETMAKIRHHAFMHDAIRLIREYDFEAGRKGFAIRFASDVWARYALGRPLDGKPLELVRDYCETQRRFQINDQPGPNIPPQVTPIETYRKLRPVRGFPQPPRAA